MAKILFIQPGYAHYRYELYQRLHENHDVTFVFLRSVRTYPGGRQPNPDWNTVWLNRKRNRIWLLGLSKIICKSKADVIVTSTIAADRTVCSVIIGWFKQTPVVLWSYRWSGMDDFDARHLPRWRYWGRNRLSRWVAQRVQAIIVSGNNSKAFHQQLGVSQDNLFIAPNTSIDISKNLQSLDALIETRTARPNVNILYFARIVKLKGLDILIKAYSAVSCEFHNVSLTVAGDGPFRKECEDLVHELQLKNVLFVGTIPNERAWEQYAAADIFVLPNNGKEMIELWGLVLNEAASMALPIVTTSAVGAAGEIVIHNKNGYVVAPDNVEELRVALKDLVANPQRRQAMGRESRGIFEAMDGYQKMYEGFDRAIEHAVSVKAPTG